MNTDDYSTLKDFVLVSSSYTRFGGGMSLDNGDGSVTKWLPVSDADWLRDVRFGERPLWLKLLFVWKWRVKVSFSFSFTKGRKIHVPVDVEK